MGWRNADDLLSSERHPAAVTVRAEPGPIPPSEDWPVPPSEDWPAEVEETDVGSLPLPERAEGLAPPGAFEAERTLQRLSDTLGESEVYRNRSIIEPSSPQETAHEASYIAAVVTDFGIRPIRSKSDFAMLRQEQESAMRLERPAMLVGIPLSFDLFSTPHDKSWLDGAGIADGSGLSVFDLRRVAVEPLDAKP
jgi:hypothetical protein